MFSKTLYQIRNTRNTNACSQIICPKTRQTIFRFHFDENIFFYNNSSIRGNQLIHPLKTHILSTQKRGMRKTREWVQRAILNSFLIDIIAWVR